MATQRRPYQRAARHLLAGLSALAAGAGVAQPASHRCPDTPVIVRSGDPRDVADVCRAATLAANQLSRCMIERHVDLSITLVDEVRHPCGVVVLGQYLSKQDRVELTTFSGCLAVLQPDNAYRQLPLRDAWRSLAAHEIAHGILGSAARGKDLAPMASEYVAYVVQISSLSAASRRTLLAAIPGKVPTDTASFNELYHAIDPLAFGVNAYRHYSAMSDGCAFLNQILRGEIAFPREDG
jgi:hypothetical protein